MFGRQGPKGSEQNELKTDPCEFFLRSASFFMPGAQVFAVPPTHVDTWSGKSVRIRVSSLRSRRAASSYPPSYFQCDLSKRPRLFAGHLRESITHFVTTKGTTAEGVDLCHTLIFRVGVRAESCAMSGKQG
ncbi:unnamed protein product [Scytosiphon promiscuus]